MLSHHVVQAAYQSSLVSYYDGFKFYKLVFDHSSFRSTALEFRPFWSKRVHRTPWCGVLGNTETSWLNKFKQHQVKQSRFGFITAGLYASAFLYLQENTAYSVFQLFLVSKSLTLHHYYYHILRYSDLWNASAFFTLLNDLSEVSCFFSHLKNID